MRPSHPRTEARRRLELDMRAHLSAGGSIRRLAPDGSPQPPEARPQGLGPVRIAEVAAEAGVARSTAAQVLARSRHTVAPATAERVRAAAARLGWRRLENSRRSRSTGVTLAAVARSAGVSRASVSSAMGCHPTRIGAGTRERIRAVARRLGCSHTGLDGPDADRP